MRAHGWTARGAWATALAGLVGFLPAVEPVEASHTIKIGIAGPTTGGDAKMGQEFEKVGRLALEERKGMVAGHKIEFLVEDDKSDPKEAVSVANKLVNAGVKAVIGHYNSSCTIPASDVYNEASIVHISATSSNPKITERGYKMLYRIITRDDQQGVFVADYLKDVAKAKRVAIIHDKTTYGQGLAEETQKALEKLGIKPVFFEAITRGEKDFTPVVTKLKAANPDFTYFTGYYAEGGILVRQFRDVGVPGTFFAGDANQDPIFIETAGKAAEGVIMSTAPLPEQVPAAAEFLKKFIAKYGPGPGPVRPLRLRRLQHPLRGDGARGQGDRQPEGRERRDPEGQGLQGRLRHDHVQRQGRRARPREAVHRAGDQGREVHHPLGAQDVGRRELRAGRARPARRRPDRCRSSTSSRSRS